MSRGTLKKTGSVIIALMAWSAALSAATQLRTQLDRAMIPVGSSTVLRITLTGSASGVKPVGYPSVPGLEINYAGMNQNLQIINGSMTNESQLIFNIIAMEPGTYKIPPFVFQAGNERLRSREVLLTVTGSGGTRSRDGAAEGGPLRTKVELSSHRAYSGEPIIMRYYLLTQGVPVSVEGFQTPPDTRGFAVKKVDESIKPSAEGEYEKNHLGTFILIPAAQGSFNVGGGAAVIMTEEQNDDFGGFPMPRMGRKRKIVFDTVRVEILPPPAAGRPESFHGDTGDFSMKINTTRDKTRVYSEKKVQVTLSGQGNVITMSKPGIHETDGVKTLVEDGESTVEVSGNAVRGTKTFTITLIPEKAGIYSAGAVTFSFFNPRAGRYVVLNSQPVRVEAVGDGKAANRESFDADEGERPDFNLAYIALIALVVAGAAVFVVLWERKRYRLAVQGNGSGAGEAAEEPAAEKSDPLADLDAAFASRDTQVFLRAADRCIFILEKRRQTGTLPADGEGKLASLKDEVYAYRYGGTAPGEGAISSIRDLLKNLYR